PYDGSESRSRSKSETKSSDGATNASYGATSASYGPSTPLLALATAIALNTPWLTPKQAPAHGTAFAGPQHALTGLRGIAPADQPDVS
ncbi:hypothetical protein ACKI2B_45980, partial [Streptomyces scabiei]